MTASWDTFDDDVTRPYRPAGAGPGLDAGTVIDDDLTTPFRPGANPAPATSRRPPGLEIEGDGLAVVVPDVDRRPAANGAPSASSPPMWAQSPPGTFRPWEPTPRPTLRPTTLVVRSRRSGRARLLATVVAALALSALLAVVVLRWLGWPG